MTRKHEKSKDWLWYTTLKFICNVKLKVIHFVFKSREEKESPKCTPAMLLAGIYFKLSSSSITQPMRISLCLSPYKRIVKTSIQCYWAIKMILVNFPVFIWRNIVIQNSNLAALLFGRNVIGRNFMLLICCWWDYTCQKGIRHGY